jgi:hypothetical protein
MLAEIAFSEHQHAAAVASAKAVLAEADAVGLDDLACDALELTGRHRMLIASELEAAQPYLLEALRRAKAADLPLARLRVLGRLAFYDLNRRRGRARMEQGRALAFELGALASVVEFDHVLAIDHLLADEIEAATSHTERALAEARRYGLRELTVLLLGLRATQYPPSRETEGWPSARRRRPSRQPKVCRSCVQRSAARRSLWLRSPMTT